MKAGEIFSYTIPDSYRMSDIHSTTVIERKAQTIYASDEIVVYASNKQVIRISTEYQIVIASKYYPEDRSMYFVVFQIWQEDLYPVYCVHLEIHQAIVCSNCWYEVISAVPMIYHTKEE